MRGSFAAVLVALLAGPAAAQRPTDVVHWTATAPAAPMKAGGTAKVTVAVDIDAGWHVYALTQAKGGPRPLLIEVAKAQPFSVRTIEGPLPTIAHDPNFDLETQYYEEKAQLTVPLVAGRGAAAGKHAVPIEITFQACDSHVCLRPFTETVTVDVAIK